MAQNLAQKLIAAHHRGGEMTPGSEVALQIDQTLAQDATGTLVMLELEAMGLGRTSVDVSAQYVDHNLLQEDHRNPDDHLFLESACRRFGLWFSRPGNGVSHPLHMQHFGRPGVSLLGADSHTCAAGALGMLAMGAGGIEVALAMAGAPHHLTMPRIWGVELVGHLPDWVSAKDVILEMLRRHGVRGAFQRIIEYHGPGVASLDPWDRHVIANMGAELGATASVFPSDAATQRFLTAVGREDCYYPLAADTGATYDDHDRIDLSALEPLIARPSSPGNVVPVHEAAGEPIYQAYVGSSANPGYRDFAVAALIVAGRVIPSGVSFDVSPTSRSVLADLIARGHLSRLVLAGARIHQAGCNGCIGMGQAPATGRNSLRTVPRNFPSRSGTREDRVWLCSPETAAASALRGAITDPRDLDMPYPRVAPLDLETLDARWWLPPGEPTDAPPALVKGPSVGELPEMSPIENDLDLPILLALANDISTDEILPAGARVLPFRSNIAAISNFCFEPVATDYPGRARSVGAHAVVAGRNYGQGSSREHAALAPRYLGLRVVVAMSFARIHWHNLVAFGVLPLTFVREEDYLATRPGEVLQLRELSRALRDKRCLTARIGTRVVELTHEMSERLVDVLLAGGVIPQRLVLAEAAGRSA